MFEIYLFVTFDSKTMPECKIINVVNTEKEAHDYCIAWYHEHKEKLPFTQCCYREKMKKVYEI